MDNKTEGIHKVTLTSDNSKQSNDIPIGGSLGLLAFGYRGIMMWRDKKMKSGIEKTLQ
jgi:hypothetical protein